METARASSRSAPFGASIRFSRHFRRPVSQPVDGPDNREQVGAITAVLGWAVISPVCPYYIGTQISVVIAALAVMRLIGFDRLWKAVILGAVVAIVAVLVSAPVTVLVFGGATVPAMTTPTSTQAMPWIERETAGRARAGMAQE